MTSGDELVSCNSRLNHIFQVNLLFGILLYRVKIYLVLQVYYSFSRLILLLKKLIHNLRKTSIQLMSNIQKNLLKNSNFQITILKNSTICISEYLWIYLFKYYGNFLIIKLSTKFFYTLYISGSTNDTLNIKLEFCIDS